MLGDDLKDDEFQNHELGVELYSEWASLLLLLGRNMKMLSFEDMKPTPLRSLKEAEQFYSYYVFIMGFSVRRFKIDKGVVKGLEVVVIRAWCYSKQDNYEPLKNKKQPPIDCERGKKQCNESTDKSRGKKKKDVYRETKYSRTGCIVVSWVKLNKFTGGGIM